MADTATLVYSAGKPLGLNTSEDASSGPDLKKFKDALEFKLVTQDFNGKCGLETFPVSKMD